MPVDTSYLSEFRRTIQDVRASRRALSFGVTDDGVTRCIAEVTRGRLIVTPQGGSATPIDFSLTDPRYDTIGGLHQALSRAYGYRSNLDEDANHDHPSIDIEPFGPVDCKGTGVELVHHAFSDGELMEIITRALQRHNPQLTLATMPPQEWVFVLPLAQSGVCKVQAYDASKRRGLGMDVSSLLQLADNFEGQYAADVQRLARAIQSPREANANLVDEGDVMLGQMNRLSLRTGYMSPIAKALPPDAAILLDPEERDVEDDNARVVWQRNKNVDFYSYELWMDASVDVIRTREGGLAYAGTPVAYPTTDDTRRDGARRETSSQMVFRSFGANSNSSRSSFSTFVEEMGQMIRAFCVGQLESESTYYFRLYVIGLNFNAVSSNVVKVTTKALRARFASPTYVNKTSGPAGTVVTVTLDSAKGAFTSSHKFRIGEKTVTPTILSSYSISFVVPAFQNKGLKELVITSPNGLLDVRAQAFTVT